MNRLFGKKKKGASKPKKDEVPPQKPVDTINHLQGTLDTLEKKEKVLEKKVVDQMRMAKEKTMKKDKRGALMCLKRKKMYESEISKCSAARLNLEQQINAMESAQINMEAFKAMKQAGGAMQEIHGELNVDAVEDCMDDINEQMEIANEITEALTNPMGEMGMQDDEDLLAELDEMEGEMLDASFMGVAGAVDEALPQAPTSAPVMAEPAAPVMAQPAAAQPVPAIAGGGDLDADELAALKDLEMM
eukprot:TRINITY_DN5129_c0_g2_i1.p1 TRINITY_DN5129_c0_g2~~TRINITY_DN5129_c0_g2_i1.p1  ORF type:complete len:246 (+),score=102.30 TRINITY_DN5129_c0_g2_i1:49-786(+)